jgi:collagenase-like PrtC family protease
MNFLEKLYDIGIRSLTIALPSIMQIVTHMKQDFKIKASVICQITNANKALFYKDMGIERIVADESINRDFEKLRKIRNTFGEKVEVIVNPVCNKNCTYRMFHYNQISSDSVKVTSTASSNYYVHRCLLRRYSSVGNLLRIAFIRPEDIKYYTAIGINYFKLQGRDTLHQGDICRAVEYYCKESYDGNLMELIDIFGANSSFNVNIDNKKLDGFLKPFFEIKGHCKDDCDNCHYCDTYARKCIDVKTAQKVYNDAKKFYSQYDEFNRILSETIFGSQENFQDEKSIEIDFDMG